VPVPPDAVPELTRQRERIRAETLLPREQRPVSSARGIHHTALIFSDVRRTVEFYQGLLGFPLIDIFENRNMPGSTHFILRRRQRQHRRVLRLARHGIPAGEGDADPSHQTGPLTGGHRTSLTFRLPDPAAVDAAYAELTRGRLPRRARPLGRLLGPALRGGARPRRPHRRPVRPSPRRVGLTNVTAEGTKHLIKQVTRAAGGFATPNNDRCRWCTRATHRRRATPSSPGLSRVLPVFRREVVYLST
jgi:catechol 2,3-dioxygenase-like lactoylglutathione lyase family enzyme